MNQINETNPIKQINHINEIDDRNEGKLFNLLNNVPSSHTYGATIDDLKKDYPFLEEEDIQAALLYAAMRLAHEEVYVV